MILLTGGSGYIGSAIVKHLGGLGRMVDAPPTQILNALDDRGIKGYVSGKIYEAMILAHGHLGVPGRIADQRLDVWMRAINLNLCGCYSLLHYAKVTGPIVVFGGARGGRIPLPERSAYAASKAALNALVITAAAEGHRIYGIAPGPQPSRHVHRLLNHDHGVSDKTRAEVRESLKHSAGLGAVCKTVDMLLSGDGEPGTFYSVRELERVPA